MKWWLRNVYLAAILAATRCAERDSLAVALLAVRRRAVVVLVAVAVCLCCAAGSKAQSYDANRDFSPTSNPNGVWSYGWSFVLGGFTTCDAERTIPFVGPSGDEWYPSALAAVDRPDVVHWQGELTMAAGPAGQYSVVRWTAPAAGAYAINASFAGFWAQSVVDGDVHVLVNGSSIYDSNIGPSWVPPVSFAGSTTVSAGDTVDFVLGYGANLTNSSDRAILSAVITRSQTALAISQVGASDRGDGTATITWKTNLPTLGTVQYGVTPSYGSSATDATITTDHSLTIGPLDPGTLYHYRVKAFDLAGDIAYSPDMTFVTSSPTTSGGDSTFHFTVQRQADGSYRVDCAWDYPDTGSIYQITYAGERLQSARLGNASQPSSPTLPAGIGGTFFPGGAVRFSIVFPPSAGTPGSRVRLSMHITADPLGWPYGASSFFFDFRTTLP